MEHNRESIDEAIILEMTRLIKDFKEMFKDRTSVSLQVISTYRHKTHINQRFLAL